MLYKHFLNPCLSLINNNIRLFSTAKDYFQNKKIKQIQKQKTIFRQDQSKLKQININLKSLSPNFFTRSLPIKESIKKKVQNKSANYVQNSYITLQIPVSSDKDIQNSLIRLTSDQVRIGRILQCMDSIAGIVGYRHCFGSLSEPNPFILVTGCVDSINLFQPITIHEDIKMQGYINYVGKTSMEVQINLFQSNVLKSNALFTMISRNALDHTKGYPCPKLIIQQLAEPELSKAKIRLSEGEENVQKRKKQISQSYKIKPPSVEDIGILHKIFLNSAEREKQGKDTDKTIVQNSSLMHVQQRNIHNKIFGGFLMRQMIETGWITASQFAQSQQLHIEDITDVYFQKPVEIGCVLKVRGRVTYTSGNILMVTMEALTSNINNCKYKQSLCCHLQMFFKCKQTQKKVFPRTYQSGMYYLTSRNLFNNSFPAAPRENI